MRKLLNFLIFSTLVCIFLAPFFNKDGIVGVIKYDILAFSLLLFVMNLKFRHRSLFNGESKKEIEKKALNMSLIKLDVATYLIILSLLPIVYGQQSSIITFGIAAIAIFAYMVNFNKDYKEFVKECENLESQQKLQESFKKLREKVEEKMFELRKMMEQEQGKEKSILMKLKDEAFGLLDAIVFEIENHDVYVPIEQKMILKETKKEGINQKIKILESMSEDQRSKEEPKVIQYIENVIDEAKFFLNHLESNL